MPQFLRVKQILDEKKEDLRLELIAGEKGLDRKITVSDISRPGLAFTGYFGHFPYERTQVIGKSEFTYLDSLSFERQIELLHKIFSHKNATCCILTQKLGPTKAMSEVFSNLAVPLLRTEFSSSALIGELIYFLNAKLAPSIKLHGVLVSVYGLGVLLVGKSGIGKSECALELVKRGHMLIADDVVNITKRSGSALFGTGIPLSKYLIEVRGLGIIDIKNVFGISNTLDEARVELVIKLEEWNMVSKMERLGLDEYFTEILNVQLPEVTIPVGPGRNLAVLVETASLNQRLKDKGFYAAREFDERVKKLISDESHGN
ncbi:MAG: HPr(Ser) kinase/phosphatase [Elusimicrobiota bacterium]|jgi:HPr kinase/phosphorylase|nr:HPr(Ser) kinase/phosphatase [Elusimicrobiota bacterium]